MVAISAEHVRERCAKGSRTNARCYEVDGGIFTGEWNTSWVWMRSRIVRSRSLFGGSR